MEDQELDVLIAHTHANFSYLSGFFTDFGGAASYAVTMADTPYLIFAILPLESTKEPFIVNNPNEYGAVVSENPWIRDVRWAGERWVVEGLKLDISDDPLQCLVEGLKERSLQGSTIGVEVNHMFKPTYDALKKALPRAKLVNASPLFLQFRMIKTKEEIRRIRKAQAILDNCYQATWSETREGMSEIEFENIFRQAAFKTGGRVGAMHVGFGAESATKLRPTESGLRKGDIITVDATVNFNGYLADINKDAVLGKPSEELRRINKALVESSQKIIENLRPEVKASDLFRIGNNVLDHARISRALASLGHGVGIQAHEPPFLGPWDHTPLAKNMVLTVEINTKKIGPGRCAAEDTILVTDDGCEVLTTLPNELHII